MNICEEDVFEFRRNQNSKESIPVNSFYRLQLDAKLPKIKEYYLGQNEPPKLRKVSDYEALKEFQMDYDKLLLDVYSPTLLRNLKNEDLVSILKEYDNLEKRMRTIINWGKGFDDNVTDWRNFYYQKMRKTETLLKALLDAKSDILNDHFVKPSDLEETLSGLNVERHQEPCFNELFSYEYFSKPIMKITGMTLQRASKFFFSPESNGTIHYDLVIPFYNMQYDQDIKGGSCAEAAGLPAFYRNKTGA